MLERIDAITNEILESVTFVLAYPTVHHTVQESKTRLSFEEKYFPAWATDCATRHVTHYGVYRTLCRN
jgi:hypothetical protein